MMVYVKLSVYVYNVQREWTKAFMKDISQVISYPLPDCERLPRHLS